MKRPLQDRRRGAAAASSPFVRFLLPLRLLTLCLALLGSSDAGHHKKVDTVDPAVCKYDPISICDLGKLAELIVTAKVVDSSAYGFFDKCLITAEIECIYNRGEWLTPQPRVGRNITISGYHLDEPWQTETSLANSEWYDYEGKCNLTTSDCSVPVNKGQSYLFALLRNTWNDEFFYFPASFDWSHTMAQLDSTDLQSFVKPDVWRPVDDAFPKWSTPLEDCRICTLQECMLFPYKKASSSCQATCPWAKNTTEWGTNQAMCWNGIPVKEKMNFFMIVIIILAWVLLMVFAGLIVWVMRNKRRQEKIAEGTYEEIVFPWKKIERMRKEAAKKKEEAKKPKPQDKTILELAPRPGTKEYEEWEAEKAKAKEEKEAKEREKEGVSIWPASSSAQNTPAASVAGDEEFAQNPIHRQTMAKV